MPPLEIMDLYDRAVLLEFRRQDDDGQPVVCGAEEISCRWEKKSGEIIDPKGRITQIDAVAVVDREIPVNSILWEGEIVDWLGTGSSGGPEPEMMRVVGIGEIPDLKGRSMRRVLNLQRFRGTKPTVE